MTSPEPQTPVVWVAAPPPPRPEPAKPRRWIVVSVIVWVAILAVGVGYAIGTGGPTDRGQTTVAEALPVVDRAASDLVRAATVDGQAVAAISGLVKTADCKVTVIRDGQRYQRAVQVFVTPGTEEALLGRVAARLPDSYKASVRTGSKPRLFADAGFYVAVNATIAAPGTVRFVIDTGDCRPAGAVAVPLRSEPSTAQRAPVQTALGWLGVPGRDWQVSQAACPGGGELTTVAATADKGSAGSLETRLAATSGHVVVATPDLFAYSVDGVGVAARAVDDSVVLTATTPCPA